MGHFIVDCPVKNWLDWKLLCGIHIEEIFIGIVFIKLCNCGLFCLLMEMCRYKHSCMGHSSFIMGLSRPETNWS